MRTGTYRLECMINDLPNDRDIRVSMFGSEKSSEVGVRHPHQETFVSDEGETVSLLGRKSGKLTYLVNPDDLSLPERLRAIKGSFVWGEVIDIIVAGEYQIVEYHPRDVGTQEIDPTKKRYSCYIDYASTGHGYCTLDEALVGVVAYKHEGPNGRADDYFCKMVGINTDPED